MRLFLTTLALAATLIPTMAQAPVDQQQEALNREHKIVFFGEGNAQNDSATQLSLINRFYMDQFRHSQDPRAPYFLLMSRNGKMAMGVGGTIKVIGDYDWDGSMDGTDFSPFDIPIPVNAADRTRFQASIGQTNLFFTVFGNDDRFGDYKLYLEAKFVSGASHNFALKKAYVTAGDFTVGLANSTFTDPATQPATIETEGPNSELSYSRILFRYMQKTSNHFSFAVAAENPEDQIGDYANSIGTSAYMPNFAAFVQYNWGKQHVRLSGLVKPMRYRNLVSDKNDYLAGWGVSLTTIFRPVAPLTVYAAGNTGYGIGSEVNDLSCGDNDLMPYSNKPGEMYTPQSFGWYVGLQYNYRPNLFSTVIVSQERLLLKDNTLSDATQYKYGLYGTANIFWDITPRCQVGAEFNIGKRSNVDGTNRLAYRAGVLAQFSF